MVENHQTPTTKTNIQGDTNLNYWKCAFTIPSNRMPFSNLFFKLPKENKSHPDPESIVESDRVTNSRFSVYRPTSVSIRVLTMTMHPWVQTTTDWPVSLSSSRNEPSFIRLRLKLLNLSPEYYRDAFLQSVPVFIIATNSS